MESTVTQMILKSKKIDLSSKDNDAILQLQGQLKIQSLLYLKLNFFKIIFLTIPVALSIIGLLLLKYYKWVRVLVFYTEAGHEDADYVYLQATDGIQAICTLNVKQGQKNNSTLKSFTFQGLKYEIIQGKAFPIGFRIFSQYKLLKQANHFTKGINETIRLEQYDLYGKNQHKVKSPMYFQYLFDVMTKPFFIMQYCICVLMILQKYQVFGAMMAVASLLTTSFNYFLLYFNFRKIQKIAEKTIQIQVLRDGKYVFIDSSELVPGDLFKPKDQIMCDAVLIRGQIYLNQSSLTGQSIPIGKFPVGQPENLQEKNRWLFQGSTVLQVKQNTLAFVVNTGYRTNRGKTIRKIMNRHAKQPDFFITAIYFFIECWIIATLIFASTLPLVFNINIATEFIIYKYLDFVGWSFPPIFPILFNVAYSLSLARLAYNNIYGNQPQKTVQGAKLNVMCFDKTGTLTQNQLQVHQVIKFNKGVSEKITFQKNDPKNYLIMMLFGSCHTVRQIDGEYVGDQVDLRMFLFSDFKLNKWGVSDDIDVKFVVENNSNQKQKMKLQILRLNQFQSQFQSMSVLVRDFYSKKTYVFLKGAPQKIKKCGINNIDNYQNLVSDLCLGGYRTIGFSYRQIKQQQIQKYMIGSRQMFEQKMTILGLIAFQNKLKDDTQQTIQNLHLANIAPKMITGDNIYIAVQTGMRSKIIDPNQKVILLEGSKQQDINFDSRGNRIFNGTCLYKKDYQIHQYSVTIKQNQYLQSRISLVVDNNFLKLSPPPQISNSIKVFARISSQNKAYIVKKYKQKISQERNKQSKLKRFFGDTKHKVGMVGDGANDLMAIKQADIGLGINQSDASYAASFTILNLSDVCSVIRQAKSSQQSIIQIVRYYGSLSFIRIIFAALLIQDATFFSSNQAIFSFVAQIVFPICYALSRPAKQMNPHSPCSNFMGLQNHLIYWGNIFWISAVVVGGLLYYKTTPQYQPNPNPVIDSGGYHSLCHSTTIVWIISQIPFILMALFIYQSNPFKERFFKNYGFLIFFLITIIVTSSFFFLTAQLGQFFNLVTVSLDKAGIIYGITIGTMLLAWLYNLLIQSFAFHEKYEGKDVKQQIKQKRSSIVPENLEHQRNSSSHVSHPQIFLNQ